MAKLRSFSMVFLLVFVSCSLFAWEQDLHYGLTKWLAFYAGFNLQDAEIIASGTQDPDEGTLYPAPSAVYASACLGHRNADLSRLVQTYHFPSYGAIPGLPDKRPVEPGSSDNAATAMVEKEIQTTLPSQPRERTLRQLGVALHPLEDSWSHQGEPAIPWTCSKDYAFGHPAARGGWRKHDADLTYLHQKPDTIDTAHHTYDKLVAFLAKHPKMADHAAVPWNKLELQVAEFAKAGSKNEKLAWFQSQKDVQYSSYSSHPGFLKFINLPDSPRKASSLNGHLMNVSEIQIEKENRPPPKDAQEFIERFLNLWIVKRIPEGALELVNPEELAKPFAEESGPANSIALTRSILDMWLVRDHGLVNLLGHGLENRVSIHEEFRKLPQIEGGPLQSAISGSGERSYDIFELSAGDRVPTEANQAYGVVFQFRHAPRDAVALIVVRDPKKGWVVNRLLWWIL